jgi:hypothetical protein
MIGGGGFSPISGGGMSMSSSSSESEQSSSSMQMSTGMGGFPGGQGGLLMKSKDPKKDVRSSSP